MSEPVLPRPLRLAGTVFASVLGIAVVATIAAGAWIGVRAASAYGHLRAAETNVNAAIDSLSDPARAADLVNAVSAETSAARALTSDPVWTAAARMPWLGPQLAAMSTISSAADDVAGKALTPLAEVASQFTLDAFRPTGGAIDTTRFAAIAGPAREGADGVARAAASVSSLQDADLLGPVRDATTRVSQLLETSAAATDALARATELLPAMLGADGPRDYLVVFQNNAEWRSLGGIVGAMTVVRTDGGRIELAAQGSSSDFTRFDQAVLSLDPEIERIYGARPARWIQNVTQVPDFSLTGELAREMWKRETGTEVDGVIAMDPVTLSYLLAATGPVTLPTGEQLTSDNAVQLLLNDVYKRYEKPADQDAFFAAAAEQVFDTLAAGRFDPAKLVSALGRAGDERRLMIWSSIEADQAVLADTTLAGDLPETTDDIARIGVYLNDGTGSKMDYYVKASTQLAWDTCSVDAHNRASGTTTLTLELTNTAPADAATSLPGYITGGGQYVKPAGTARTVVYIYLPEGYELAMATLTGDNGYGGGTHRGRQVLSFDADLAPGESVTAVVSVRSPKPAARTVVAEMTPTIDPAVPTSFVAICDTP